MSENRSWRGEKLRNSLTGLGLALTLISLSTPAHAYLDPGTGSIILQGLIAGVAACCTVVSLNYHRFKAKLRSIFGKTSDDKSGK